MKLTNEQLCTQYQSGDESALVRLLEQNERFCWLRSKPFIRAGHDEEDCLQAARMGILRAADKWDSSSGTKFLTYAGWYILSALQEEVGETSGRVGRVADRRYGKAKGFASIDAPLGSTEDSGTLLHELGEESQRIDQLDANEALDHYLELLDDRERDILLRRTNGETLTEIGSRHGLARERIRQIYNRALMVGQFCARDHKPFSVADDEAKVMKFLGSRGHTVKRIAQHLKRAHHTVLSRINGYKRKSVWHASIWKPEHDQMLRDNAHLGWQHCAKLLGRTPASIHNRVRRLGIAQKTPGRHAERIIAFVDTQLTTTQIAEKIGMSSEGVRSFLVRRGIKRDHRKLDGFCKAPARIEHSCKLASIRKRQHASKAKELGFEGLPLGVAIVTKAIDSLITSDKRQIARWCKAECDRRGWNSIAATPQSAWAWIAKANEIGLVTVTGKGRRLRQCQIS